jgi:hypothetical protein
MDDRVDLYTVNNPPDDDSIFVEKCEGARAAFNTNCPIIVR